MVKNFKKLYQTKAIRQVVLGASVDKRKAYKMIVKAMKESGTFIRPEGLRGDWVESIGIDGLFQWHRTKQGRRYWKDIQDRGYFLLDSGFKAW